MDSGADPAQLDFDNSVSRAKQNCYCYYYSEIESEHLGSLHRVRLKNCHPESSNF